MSASRSSSAASVAQNHPSRRENYSVSSSYSAPARSERGNSSRPGNSPAVESAVTRLLMSIKQLLEALTQWSQSKVDEIQVSDVYVRLGNDFNAAVAAFAAFNIDMNELLSVPDELRTVLEQCLAEDPTKDNLEIYLPNVRQIITNLLQGLRGKQSIYRRIVSDHRRGSESSGHERTESRSSRSSKREQSHRSQLSRTVVDDDLRKGAPSSSGRRREPSGREQMNGTDFIGGFSPQIMSPTLQDESDSDIPNTINRSSHRRHASTSQSALKPSPELPEPSRSTSPLPPQQAARSSQAPSAPSASGVPPSVKRYSLVDKPMSSPPTPNVVVEPSSPDYSTNSAATSSTTPTPTSTSPPPPPPPESPPIDVVQTPLIANSLAALKKSDTLERRASKRFSTYNISKMTGGATARERPGRSQPNNRRSMAVSSALTPNELAVLTEVDDEGPETPPSGSRAGSAMSMRPSLSRSVTPDKRGGIPLVPPLPKTPTPEPQERRQVAVELPIQEAAEPLSLTVFLQLGREVKKATIEPGLSFSSLRVLFVDKFSYNPGLENFPAIYIRDPSSGVQYELEDMDEVKEKCLLSLNVEPLDQIKQHIDSQISSLSQDIKDLRSAVSSNAHRQSFVGSPILAHPLAESTPAPNRPTDKQFHTVARRLSRYVGNTSGPSSPITAVPMMPQMTGQSLQPQMTGSSVYSEYSSRVVSDLKTQFDEVQNLRRDLGVMRQVYTEFVKQTKESLGTLRTQTQSVKQLANVNVGGARAFIENGKTSLDTRSQNVLTQVEKLQDTVETIKADVLKRFITPKAQYMKGIWKDIDGAASELESLREHIMTVKPMWKKTWQEELQNIVEEQQFLNHQEEFLNDLLEDHKALVDVFGHVEKVIDLRGNGPARMARNRSFKPPPIEEGHNGLSTVMLEIRGAAVDPEKRMKAIEESRKARMKELETRTDDLHSELTDFVGGKKLKMTGGAEEAERVRQKRNEMTLKAMFTGGSAAGDASQLGTPVL